MFVFAWPVNGQETDSMRVIALEDVTVIGDSYKKATNRNAVLSVEVAGKEFLTGHFTGNLMQTLEYISGVRSMDIGSGFSKPMIRGMGFNRVAVTENGLKQEGQQWGSDHGLEIDAFNIERIAIRKGPSSLLYGSDAMGGVIEITVPPAPVDDQIFGEVSLLCKSVNSGFGGSLMLGIKQKAWHIKARYSEQRFGDYRVPTDTIVYLTQRMPVYGRKLKNTAGLERNANLYTEYRKGGYYANYAVSNAYQKTGFFPGAHGVPDISRVQNDGRRRNVEYP
jgi:iron complex outermembrane receptor protein